MNSWKHLVAEGQVFEMPIDMQVQMFSKLDDDYRKQCPELSDGFINEFRQNCISLFLEKGAVINVQKSTDIYNIVAVKGLVAGKVAKLNRTRVPWFMGGENCELFERSFYLPIGKDLKLEALEDSCCIFIDQVVRNEMIKKYVQFGNIVNSEQLESFCLLEDRTAYKFWEIEDLFRHIYVENSVFTARIPDQEIARYLQMEVNDVRHFRMMVE